MVTISPLLSITMPLPQSLGAQRLGRAGIGRDDGLDADDRLDHRRNIGGLQASGADHLAETRPRWATAGARTPSRRQNAARIATTTAESGEISGSRPAAPVRRSVPGPCRASIATPTASPAGSTITCAATRGRIKRETDISPAKAGWKKPGRASTGKPAPGRVALTQGDVEVLTSKADGRPSAEAGPESSAGYSPAANFPATPSTSVRPVLVAKSMPPATADHQNQGHRGRNKLTAGKCDIVSSRDLHGPLPHSTHGASPPPTGHMPLTGIAA